MTAQVESSMRRVAFLISLSMYILLWFGCASSDVVPDSLEPQIDKSLTFDQIIASPDSYCGRTVVVGGEVLKGRRLNTRRNQHRNGVLVQ